MVLLREEESYVCLLFFKTSKISKWIMSLKGKSEIALVLFTTPFGFCLDVGTSSLFSKTLHETRITQSWDNLVE